MVREKELQALAFNGGGVMNKTVVLRGPVLTRSGYGEQARFALRALRSREDIFDIYINPVQWGQTSWLNEESEERQWMDQKIEKTIAHIQSGGTFDYSVQVTIPNEWESLAETNIGYTAGIETTKISHQWIEKSQLMNQIIVVSNHSKNIYNNTEYRATVEATGQEITLKNTTPITAVNYPVKTYENLEPLDVEISSKYNFVCVAQFGPRKNIEKTIQWFVEEFHDEEDIGLIVKTSIAKNSSVDREVCDGRLKAILSAYPERKCKLHLLHGDMTDEEMHSLYLHPNVNVALSLTHGEGFGLPLFEAAYMGVPVVAPGWSGQMDFLCDENGKERFHNVSFDITQIPASVVWEGVLVQDSGWAVARETSAKAKMRTAIDEVKAGNTAQYQEYAAELKERFEVNKMYKEFVDAMGIDEAELDVENWLDGLDIEEIE
jgi:glycosyltransferase involved in cell wall biosynthesis